MVVPAGVSSAPTPNVKGAGRRGPADTCKPEKEAPPWTWTTKTMSARPASSATTNRPRFLNSVSTWRRRGSSGMPPGRSSIPPGTSSIPGLGRETTVSPPTWQGLKTASPPVVLRATTNTD